MADALRPGVSLVGTVVALEPSSYVDKNTGERKLLEGLFSLRLNVGPREMRADFYEFDDLGDRSRVFSQWKDGSVSMGDFVQVMCSTRVSGGRYVNFNALHVTVLESALDRAAV